MEAGRTIKYSEMGMLSGALPRSWASGIELPHLGEAQADQHIGCERFLIVRKDSQVVVKSMRMHNGRLRYDAEQPENPDSVILNMGGLWKDGTLIAGSITTISDTAFSQSLMRSAKSALKKHFTRVRAFWVGPEALVALREGRRLASAVQSPPEYDLQEAR